MFHFKAREIVMALGTAAVLLGGCASVDDVKKAQATADAAMSAAQQAEQTGQQAQQAAQRAQQTADQAQAGVSALEQKLNAHVRGPRD